MKLFCFDNNCVMLALNGILILRWECVDTITNYVSNMNVLLWHDWYINICLNKLFFKWICLKFVKMHQFEISYIWYITYSTMYTLHEIYKSYVFISHSDKNQHHMISAQQARQEYSQIIWISAILCGPHIYGLENIYSKQNSIKINWLELCKYK